MNATWNTSETVSIRAEYKDQNGNTRQLSNHGRSALLVGRKPGSELLMVLLLDADGMDSGEYTTVTPDNIVYPPAETNEENVAETVKTAGVTDEMVQALAVIRNQPGRTSEEALRNILEAFDTLDNAGVFAAIDEATGYDIAPAPERVSKCTCKPGQESHNTGCPGDPAEWGDMAYTTVTAKRNEQLTAEHSAALIRDRQERGGFVFRNKRQAFGQ